MGLFGESNKDKKHDYLIPKSGELSEKKIKQKKENLEKFTKKFNLEKKDAEMMIDMLCYDNEEFFSSASAFKGDYHKIMIMQNWLVIKKLDQIIKKMDK